MRGQDDGGEGENCGREQRHSESRGYERVKTACGDSENARLRDEMTHIEKIANNNKGALCKLGIYPPIIDQEGGYKNLY